MKIATTVVIQFQRKILLAKRLRDDRWELPGGKLDPGETPEQCIVREVKEELGMDIKLVKHLEVLEGTFRGIPMLVYAFLAQYSSGAIVLNVHKDARWVGINELDVYDIVEEDKLIIERLQNGYYQNAA